VRWGDGEAVVVEESDLCFLFKGSGVAARFLKKKKMRGWLWLLC